MKKILLVLAFVPALVSCGGDENSTVMKGELKENEVLRVYYTAEYADLYTFDGYSSVHNFGSSLKLTKVTYTYWVGSNALNVKTDLGLIKYRGYLTNFTVTTRYGKQ